MKLTKKVVDALPFSTSGQRLVWDDELTGFGLRISRSKKTYIVQGRVNGRSRRVSLGDHGVITLFEARKRARKILSGMLEGVDPVVEKKRSQARSITLRDVVEGYIEARRELKESSRHDIKKHLRTSFSVWADRPILEITRDKVAKRFQELSERGPAQANQAFRILRALFNFARGEYRVDGKPIITDNPVAILSETKRWNAVRARTGRIPTSKIGVSWNVLHALREAPEQTVISRTLADAVSFLLLTGCRWSEMAELTWDRVNLDDPSWYIPDPKNRQPVTFPMSDLLRDILSERPRTSRYVFPSPRGDRHITRVLGVLGKVSQAIGTKVTAHDLRRTFRAVAMECGIELWKTKLLMNHKLTGDVTIEHYTETSDLRYLAPEINRIARWIEQQARIATAGKKVIPMRRGF